MISSDHTPSQFARYGARLRSTGEFLGLPMCGAAATAGDINSLRREFGGGTFPILWTTARGAMQGVERWLSDNGYTRRRVSLAGDTRKWDTLVDIPEIDVVPVFFTFGEPQDATPYGVA